jgi:hypothetical protein
MRLLHFVVSMLMFSPVYAQQATREAQVGLLHCTIEGGTGFIIGSVKTLNCVFERSDARPSENYTGEIKKFGIDIGRTRISKLSWAVFAPSKAIEEFGRLAGSYGGVTGEVTVGIGLGANVLVGGFDKSVALQPFSLQAQQGLNIAAGISSLDLRAQ